MTSGVIIVSHTHWDREWYRTFEAFRARLVDTVDRVLDQLDEDNGWRFLLDGQAIVVRFRCASSTASGLVGPRSGPRGSPPRER